MLIQEDSLEKNLLIDKINNLTNDENKSWNHQYILPDNVKTRKSDINSSGYNIPKWQRLEPIINELIKNNKTFLDIGCSDGFFCINIAQKNVEKVLGLDLDPLRIERSNFMKKFFNLDNVEFRVQDLYDIIGKESFDVTLGLGLLHRVPDIDECISRICDISNKFVIFEFKTLIGLKDEIVSHGGEKKSNDLNRLYGTPTKKYVSNRLSENNFSTIQILEDTMGNLQYPRTIIVGKREV